MFTYTVLRRSNLIEKLECSKFNLSTKLLDIFFISFNFFKLNYAKSHKLLSKLCTWLLLKIFKKFVDHNTFY